MPQPRSAIRFSDCCEHCLLICKGDAITESQILLVQNWQFSNINYGDTRGCNDLKPAPLYTWQSNCMVW